MKKILMTSLVLVFVLCGVLFGCNSPHTEHEFNNHVCSCGVVESFTVKFIAGEGGRIDGETEQVVEYGKYTTTVTAIDELGYNFDGWSDGVTDIEREIQVTENLTLTANFVSVQVYTVKFENLKNGSVEGGATQYVEEGESLTVEAIADVGYKFISWSDGDVQPERVIETSSDITLSASFEMEFLDLPVFIINTEEQKPITSKENYVQCMVSVKNAEEEYCFENYTAQIRGRGNSSWGFEKKPYKLQFVESDTNGKKVDLFGNGKAKTWTLIANYSDLSLSRNAIAYEIGRAVTEIADTTTTTRQVEVYLNGRYDGVYLICEQMQAGENRVEIEEDLENGVNTGYLLELDHRAPSEGVQGIDYFYVRDIPFAIKSPDTEDELFTAEFNEYIKNYLSLCFDTIELNYQEACKLIDMDSFASGYIVHELIKSCDVGYSSFYVHKDKNGLLKCGPIWDFDFSSGNCGWVDLQPEKMYASNSNIFFRLLLKHQEFKDLVKDKLDLYGNKIVNILNNFPDTLLENRASYERNFLRWDSCWEVLKDYGENGQPEEILAITTWEGQVIYLQEWLFRSFDAICEKYY